MLNNDPTDKYTKNINSAINKCVNLLDTQARRNVKHIKPKAPEFTGLPKLHKENLPVRPLINYTSAPTYKIAKKLQHIIKNSIKMENVHSVKNTLEFIEKIKTIEILPNYKLVSMDIVNLYTNIPVLETLHILKNNLIKTGILNQIQIDELLFLLQIILQQNYFTYDNKFFNQEDNPWAHPRRRRQWAHLSVDF